MSRVMLLLSQLAVAVVFLGLWQLLATVPVVRPHIAAAVFLFHPVDVGSQIVDWFSSGVIWKASDDHAVGVDPRFCDRFARGVLVGFCFARQPRVAAIFDPYVKMANALPRVVLAPIFTLWLGSASGRRWRSGHAGVLQSCSSTSIRASGGLLDRARQWPHARHD